MRHIFAQRKYSGQRIVSIISLSDMMPEPEQLMPEDVRVLGDLFGVKYIVDPSMPANSIKFLNADGSVALHVTNINPDLGLLSVEGGVDEPITSTAKQSKSETTEDELWGFPLVDGEGFPTIPMGYRLLHTFNPMSEIVSSSEQDKPKRDSERFGVSNVRLGILNEDGSISEQPFPMPKRVEFPKVERDDVAWDVPFPYAEGRSVGYMPYSWSWGRSRATQPVNAEKVEQARQEIQDALNRATGKLYAEMFKPRPPDEIKIEREQPPLLPSGLDEESSDA